MDKQYDNNISILFVCHGNICRSPMAEFVLRDLVKQKDLSNFFRIASAATSDEEVGNSVHRGTKEKLRQHGISTEGKYAIQLKKSDYDIYDYLIGMEEQNIIKMKRITGGDPGKKISRLLDFSNRPRDIADPWYTGDFDRTYKDILEGCEFFLDYLLNNNLYPQGTP